MRPVAALVALAAGAGLVATAAPAAAGSGAGATVTRGPLTMLPTGVARGYHVTGRAQMVRTASGSTVVTLHAMGLHPGTVYLSHVHKSSCEANQADGHYRFDPSGPAAPPNEIWLNFVSDSGGNGNSNATAHAVAGPAAVSVVIHDADGKKIACADLG